MDIRRFKITYCKLNNKIIRNAVVDVSKPTGNIGQDAHTALNIFVSIVGNLKRNDILEIQELDNENNPVGEPITPMGENSFIPYRK